MQPLPAQQPAVTSGVSEYIRIRGARAHNLKALDVDIPKGKLTVISGVSGSGKSSLVHDVLEAEARRRFLASLSMYERQSTREGPEAEVDSISGLGVTLSIGPERRLYERRATVGVASELSYHLAVLLAYMGERRCPQCGANMQRGGQWTCPHCGAQAPIASPRHFIPSNYAAACTVCNGVGSRQTPQPEKLIIHPEKPLCGGAMYSPGFFPQGYLGKPGNGGYYLLRALAERFGFDPDHTPWQEMSPQAQQVFLYGDEELMLVQGESHSGRRWQRQAPFPGFYGFIRDWDVGGTYTRSEPCPECGGGRLRPQYAAVTLAGRNPQELGDLSLYELARLLNGLSQHIDETQPYVASLMKMRKRLAFLSGVGLGYLHLERVSATLSAGEAQRVRLAGLLGSGMTSLTLLLDEPTRGLHPREVDALVDALRKLRDEGNTLLVIEHDGQVLQAADLLLDIGPAAGAAGGRVVACGSPQALSEGGESLTADWLAGRRTFPVTGQRRSVKSWLRLYGATANNLRGNTLELPLGVLTGVCGVSGSGKSTLLLDTLGRVLAPRKQTTSVAYEPLDPGVYERLEGAPARVVLVDQARSGISSPGSFLNIERVLRRLYAQSEDALALGMAEEQFKRTCTVCGGSGLLRSDMGFLPDIVEECELCRGSGYAAEVWQVRLRGLCLPELDSLSLQQVFDLWQDEDSLRRPLQAACEVGLGYLALRQPGYSLSGGEAQRLKLAAELCKSVSGDTLYLLDEPSLGQHFEDVLRLSGVLQRLVDGGGSVVIVEHHPQLLACCDWLVELGPGGGPQGGRIIAAGTPEELAAMDTPTAPYLKKALEEMR